MKLIDSLMERLWHLSAAKKLVLGFAAVILCGVLLLMLPISLDPGVRITFLEALFESTSAVCVTGLTVVPVSNTFNVFGCFVMACLIQIGGMGVALLSIGFIMAAGRRMGYGTRTLFVQAENLFGYSNMATIAIRILRIILIFEGIGALLCWPIFAADHSPLEALGIACFHSVSAFNNAGFDCLGGFDSLCAYASNVPLNLITCFLVISGGFGFIAMLDLKDHKFHWHKLLLNTKIVIVMTALLLAFGTIFFALDGGMTWLEAFFQSTIARTAGFATVPMASFTRASLMVFIILMFIGASPGSTGGGIKTTTAFVAALKAWSSSARHNEDSAFYRRIPDIIFSKAFVVIFFGMCVLLTGTILILTAQPDLEIGGVLCEVTSAFGTVGSSLLPTTTLNDFSRVVIIIIMFIGRLGPVTIANTLITKHEITAEFTEEDVLIG